MTAFALDWQRDELRYLVLLNMAFLTAAIALFMYRKKDMKPRAIYSMISKLA